jgi:hypothetical protein
MFMKIVTHLHKWLNTFRVSTFEIKKGLKLELVMPMRRHWTV